MKALRDPESPSLASMPTVKSWLRNADAALGVVRAKYPNSSGDHMTRALIEENVLLQIQHLRTHPGVAAGLASGTVRLHGWIYNIGNGRVLVYDETIHDFAPIEEVLGIATGKPG
jgi:carbonic anhydrase